MIIDMFANHSFITDRIKVTPLNKNQNQFIFELLNSKSWKTFIGERNILTVEDADKYIQKINLMPETIYWVVFNLNNNVPMGIISLMKRVNFDFYDLGFAFLDRFQNKGYALEASEKIIQYLKDETHFRFIIAITINKNINSIRLLEKLHFVLEREYTKNNENLILYQLEL